MHRIYRVLSLAAVLAGCPIQEPVEVITEDSGIVDSGTYDPEEDASAPVKDASVKDTGVVPEKDAGVVEPVQDAGPVVVDAGQPIKDSGVVDPGPVDSGVVVVPGKMQRPATSHGVGFFVVGNKLYDANGNEFRIRGTNRLHIDSWVPYVGKMPSNSSRWNLYFEDDPDRMIRDIQSPNMGGTTTNGKDVPVLGFWGGTCKSDSGSFNSAVNKLIRDAAKYQAIERFSMFNPLNEWGGDEIAWRDAYVAAIPRIRAAGYHGALVIDAPGCGQQAMAFARHGQAIFNSDPERNVIADIHIYGVFYDSEKGINKQWNEQLDIVPTFDALAATGMHIYIGEFGPGRNIGPSPTMVTPQRIVELAEARGFSWATWAVDDWNQANETSTDDWFGHIKQGWTYNSDADLTTWGREAKALWIKYNATTASIFP